MASKGKEGGGKWSFFKKEMKKQLVSTVDVDDEEAGSSQPPAETKSSPVMGFFEKYAVKDVRLGEKCPVYIYKSQELNIKKWASLESIKLRRTASLGDLSQTKYPGRFYRQENPPNTPTNSCESVFGLIPAEEWVIEEFEDDVRRSRAREEGTPIQRLRRLIRSFRWPMLYNINMIYIYILSGILLIIFTIVFATM